MPDQTPVGGRRTSSTRAASSRTTSIMVRRSGKGLPGRDSGNCSMRPSRSATQLSCSGQSTQDGSLRVHKRRAEIHDRLAVVGQPVVGKVLLRQLPEDFFDRRAAWPAIDAVVATQGPLDVAVEDGEALSVRLGKDRAGRAAADAGKRGQRVELVGQLPVMPGDADSRRGVQVAGAGVVTESCP